METDAEVIQRLRALLHAAETDNAYLLAIVTDLAHANPGVIAGWHDLVTRAREAVAGSATPTQFNGEVLECSTCHGEGGWYDASRQWATCHRCDGEGLVAAVAGFGDYPTRILRSATPEEETPRMMQGIWPAPAEGRTVAMEDIVPDVAGSATPTEGEDG
jgi:hypothetical protein